MTLKLEPDDLEIEKFSNLGAIIHIFPKNPTEGNSAARDVVTALNFLEGCEKLILDTKEFSKTKDQPQSLLRVYSEMSRILEKVLLHAQEQADEFIKNTNSFQSLTHN